MSPFLKFLTEDWYFAIPMILMSLTALTLVFWRIFLNVHAKSDIGELLPIFQQKLEREEQKRLAQQQQPAPFPSEEEDPL